MILVVDDDPVFLEQAKLQLAGSSERGVFFAGDAPQALSLIRELGSDLSLALIDLDLPGTNGFELMLEVRDSFPDFPVIAISGVVHQKVLECAKAFGAIEVLSKPITSAWNDTIRRVLTSRRRKSVTQS
jgi:CheY-like chemotaxis protein